MVDLYNFVAYRCRQFGMSIIKLSLNTSYYNGSAKTTTGFADANGHVLFYFKSIC